MASLILAVRFLTILPVPGREASGSGALGRAAWWFPAIGLGLGACLAAADRVFGFALPPLLAALAVLALWKIATGGIHLDGLADCLDGLAGRDPAQRLAIMRDSRIGVFGAIGLIVCTLASLLALAELPAALRGRILLIAPMTGRLAPLLIGPLFRAATPEPRMGGQFLSGLSRWAGPPMFLAALALATWLVGPWGPAVIAAALLAVLAWSAFVARRLGGLTGDVLGSGVELGELGALLAASSLAHLGAI